MKGPQALALLALCIALMVLAVGMNVSKACAATVTPSTFCAVAYVNVANGTGGDLTDYGVQFTYPALAAAGAKQIDARGLDLFATDTGFNEIPVIAQDMDTTAARFWIQVPSLPDGTSITYAIYSGAERLVHDQGIFFDSSASSSVTVTHDAALAVTSDFKVELHMSTDGAAPGAPQWAVSKWSSNQGYRIGIVDSGGLKVRAQLDTTTCDSAVWDGSDSVWSMEHWSGNLRLFKDGVSVCSTADVGGAATTDDVVIGSGLDAAQITHVAVLSGFPSAPAVEGRWGFNADQMSEDTYATAGPATGTVEDRSGNNHDGDYTWTWDQTDITVTVSPIVLTSAGLPVTFNQDLVDFFGTGLQTDPSTAGARYQYLPFAGEIEEFEDVLGWPDGAVVAYVATMVAFMFVVAVAMTPRANDFMIATALVVPLVVGAGMNWYAPWYPMVWAVIGFGTAGARRLFR